MSALPPARRSRSKTAPDHGDVMADAADPTPAPTDDLADAPPSSPPRPVAAAGGDYDSNSATLDAAAMLSALPTARPGSQLPQPKSAQSARAVSEDPADNGSSSLSELGDASDDQSESTPRAPAAAGAEDDSEAETERLERTPRKLTRTATNTTLASEHMYERTPSKLAHSTLAHADESVPTSPISPTPSLPTADAPSGNSALDTLSFLAASEAATLENAGKKRKRSTAESSAVDGVPDEPVPKRRSTSRQDGLNGRRNDSRDNHTKMHVDEILDNAEERISALAQEEVELEERQAQVATETVNELATVAKLTKGRKGGRRGKRKLEDSGGGYEAAVQSVETLEADVDGDNEEEDGANLDEEVSKKKNAIDDLARIEKKFKIFQQKLCDEQIAQCEQELEMLKQPVCAHPEYLAMIQCVDERRAGKIAHEKHLLQFKQEALARTTTAERHQLHSQYFQTVRDIREEILATCHQKIFDLQRGRREMGVDKIEYSLRLPEKRSEQIRQQTAYNLEVSILSGVAKYVGFPAAPDIAPAKPAEVDEDLRAMKITTRQPAQPVPYVRPYNRNTTVEEATAEEQFLERTPWANPQHPMHQQYAHGGPARAPIQTYQTPAGQRRVVDIHAPNGSASTIEVNSNPPSSTAGQNMHSNGRMVDSESPVLHMKRPPSEHPQYLDTPNSAPRPFAALSRETYGAHPTSSPASDAHAESWAGGMRPLNVGPSPNMGRQAPLTQRSALGAVSVGNGGTLFGR